MIDKSLNICRSLNGTKGKKPLVHIISYRYGPKPNLRYPGYWWVYFKCGNGSSKAVAPYHGDLRNVTCRRCKYKLPGHSPGQLA